MLIKVDGVTPERFIKLLQWIHSEENWVSWEMFPNSERERMYDDSKFGVRLSDRHLYEKNELADGFVSMHSIKMSTGHYDIGIQIPDEIEGNGYKDKSGWVSTRTPYAHLLTKISEILRS